jgi:hypothetical protein
VHIAVQRNDVAALEMLIQANVDLNEAKNVSEAIHILNQNLQPHINEPYNVIAFSQGALYFQLWMNQNLGSRPLKQVLLAPAIYIKNHKLLDKIFASLPYFFPIKSSTPKPLRRYAFLYIWEYRILFKAIELFQSTIQKFPVKTLVIVDPKDELIETDDLRERWIDQIHLFQRPYLRGKRPGKYHIIFHPEYFSDKDWSKLINLIKDFILND